MSLSTSSKRELAAQRKRARDREYKIRQLQGRISLGRLTTHQQKAAAKLYSEGKLLLGEMEDRAAFEAALQKHIDEWSER